MSLEQLHLDRSQGQTQLLAHQVHGTDPAIVERPAPFGRYLKWMLLALIIGASVSTDARIQRRSIRRLRFRRILGCLFTRNATFSGCVSLTTSQRTRFEAYESFSLRL
jgi:hypothetical protein